MSINDRTGCSKNTSFPETWKNGVQRARLVRRLEQNLGLIDQCVVEKSRHNQWLSSGKGGNEKSSANEGV